MNSFNVTGRLGQDPELNEVGEDAKVANFSIANDEGYGTNWFDVAAWNGQAEFVMEHFSKGDRIEITGAVEMDDEYGASVRAYRVGFGGGSKKQEGGGDFEDPDDDEDVPF